MNNILLLGMPGVGKSTIGRLLATMLDVNFVDTDTYICETTNKDPAEHFAGLNDTDALKLEIKLIENIKQKNGIIALSGSVPMTDEGMKLVRSWGKIFIELEAEVDTIIGRVEQRPDRYSRIIFGKCKTIEELRAFRRGRFQALRTHVADANHAPIHILSQIIQFIQGEKKSDRNILESTQDHRLQSNFRDAILTARPEKGLWYRDIISLPFTKKEQIVWQKLAQEDIYKCFESLWKKLDTGFSSQQIGEAIKQMKKWRNQEILPFRQYSDNTTILDLTQGPTGAFKDFALQILSSFVSQTIEQLNERKDDQRPEGVEKSASKKDALHLMVAQTSTSGDTGPAGGAGICGKPCICNVIGYPEHEASYVQKRQMHELEGNVFSFGYEESFSSIQKSMLAQNTPEFRKKLRNRCEHILGKPVKIHTGSFNSINPGRIDAQMIYHAIAQLQAKNKGLVDPIYGLAVVVPSGNGGHMFGALTARIISGVPGPTIVSCNANDFFYNLIHGGTFTLPPKNSAIHQPSVSMIIEYPNNMERLFRLAFGPHRTADIMTDFFAGKTVLLSESEKYMLSKGLNLHAVVIRGQEELECMRDYWGEKGSMVCPHTANGLAAWKQVQYSFPHTHALICETASPWKFLASFATATSGATHLGEKYETLRPFEGNYKGTQKLIKLIENGYKKANKKFQIPDFIKPWLVQETPRKQKLSCEQFDNCTLESVEKWASHIY